MDSLPDMLRMRLAALSEQLNRQRRALERRRAKVEAMERELAKLREAAATFQQHFPDVLPDIPEVEPDPKPGNESVVLMTDGHVMDLVGKSIRQCSEAILAEQAGAALHYSQIAKAAMERGYRSPKNKDAEAITRSFWDTLRRISTEGSAEDGSPKIAFLGRGTFRWTVRADGESQK